MYSVKGLGGKAQLGCGRERGFELVVAVIHSLKEPVYAGKPRRTGPIRFRFGSSFFFETWFIDTILKVCPLPHPLPHPIPTTFNYEQLKWLTPHVCVCVCVCVRACVRACVRVCVC